MIIENIIVKRIAQNPPNATPSGIKTRTTVTVKSRNIHSSWKHSLTSGGEQRQCQGAFNVPVERTHNPDRGSNYLYEAGVKKLSCGESKTFFCNQWFASESSAKIKTMADHMKWTDKSSENSNDWTTPARQGVRLSQRRLP